jgi:predicted nucleic acid-binding protein
MLDNFVWNEIGIEAVLPHVPRLMTEYGLGSYDAVHVGTALVAEVADVVTTDAGFGAVPETLLTIHTDRSRLASCRERRRVQRRNQ